MTVKKRLSWLIFLNRILITILFFSMLSSIREHTEDENHIISIAGEPMHMGFIYQNTASILMIIGITIVAVIMILFVYYRTLRAVVVPCWRRRLLPSGVCGFMGLMRYNLDPLILVLPFFLSLMTMPHAMQCITRFIEEYENVHDMKKAAAQTIEALFLPGITSVVTDALGIALVGIAGIPMLVNIAITSVFWCIATATLFALIMTPLLLSYIPESKRLRKRIDKGWSDRGKTGGQECSATSGSGFPQRGKWYIAVTTLLLFRCRVSFTARQMQIG